MKGKYIINTLNDFSALKHEKQGTTLVCCFSRMIFVPFFFKALEKIDMPRSDIHLLIYDNTQDGLLQMKLEEEIKKIQKEYEVIISDNGKGQIEEPYFQNIATLGLNLFALFAKDQILSHIETDIAKGTLFKVRVISTMFINK